MKLIYEKRNNKFLMNLINMNLTTTNFIKELSNRKEIHSDEPS